MKLMNIGVWNSFFPSRIVLKANIWSRQLLPFLNLACSRRILSSIGSWMRFSMHLVKTLRIIHNRVMPLQLLHCPKSPFFGSLHISLFVQSDGISSFSRIFLRSGSSISALNLGDAFKRSPTMSSTPPLLWGFNLFIADSISDLLGGFVGIFKVREFKLKSGNSSGSFLFKRFSKRSAQRSSWLSQSGKGTPFESFTGTVPLLNFPDNSFVVWYSVLRSPLAAAFSASVDLSSNSFVLSFAMLFLTALCFSLYSSFNLGSSLE